MVDRGVVGALVKMLGLRSTFGVLLALSALMFGYLVPKAKRPVFADASPDVPRKVLDEYVWTWTPEVAHRFFSGIGLNGRRAYQRFYWSTDFWFPSLTASFASLSLLLLAFSPVSRLAWLVLLAFAGWLFDVLENVNHFRMAGSYPSLSPLSLRFGPLLTRMKWTFALAPWGVALLGFALRVR